MVVTQSNRGAERAVPSRRSGGIALAAMLLHAAAVQAGESDASMFSVSGFGSLGVVHSSESKADFVRTFIQNEGAGYSRSWSTAVDSRLAAQLSVNVNDQLSAVLQVVSEQQWDGSFTPKVEWANVQYAFTPNLSVRVGRIALSTSLLSDSAKVAYTLPWVRVPNEVFRALVLSNSDGIDTTYRVRIGNVTNRVTAHYGRGTGINVPDGSITGSPVEQPDFFGFSDTVTFGHATLHVGYSRANVLIKKLRSLPDPALSAMGLMPGAAMTAGASYDPGNWFAMGEAVRSKWAPGGTTFAWYISAGPRIGKLTPYLTYARINQETQPLLGSPVAQRTVTAGLRWDVVDNVAFKVQYERQKRPEGSVGTLIPKAGFLDGGKSNVISTVVDFIY